MKKFESIAPLKNFLSSEKRGGKTVSFVPTMGAFHKGHKSCIEIAKGAGDLLVVSLFVNPTQFEPGEDFEVYPKRLEEDLKCLEEWNCDAAFIPSTAEIYPVAQEAWVNVESVTGVLCGKHRPDHFRGVATVVAKLFNIVAPDVAVFGQKDAQQAIVIRMMARQLNFPVRIVLSPIIREADGLAVSSRNDYLSGQERERASAIYRSLCHGRQLLRSGERTVSKIVESMRERLSSSGIGSIEYIDLLSADDLSRVDPVRGKVLLAVAGKVGETRLIDNMVLKVEETVGEAELF